MPKISNVIPLPGVSELQDLAQGFFRRLRDVEVEYDKRAALASQLDSLIKCAGDIDDLPELNAQLTEIQRRFETTEALRCRIGLRQAQYKLKIWDELKVKLDEAIQVNTLKVVAQTRKDVTNLLVARSYTPKVDIAPAYEITSQVEISQAIWPEDLTKRIIEPPERVKTILRSGKYKHLSVTYRTFVADSKRTTHELVERAAQRISVLLHVNVATLVGLTEGYHGLNGIIFVAPGIDYRDFVLKVHSGDVWAKCIRGFNAIRESGLNCSIAERITVAPDGHVTVLPAVYRDILFTGVPVDVCWGNIQVGGRPSRMDLGARLLLDVYGQSCRVHGRRRLDRFVGHIHELGPAFTELQVIQTASFGKLFPYNTSDCFGGIWGPLPSFQPNIGEFGWTTYQDGKLVGWESLGFSRHIDRTDPFWFEGILEGYNSTTPNGDQWLTYILWVGRSDPDFNYKTITLLHKLHWEDIFTEAREISQRLNIELDSIAFCTGVECDVSFGKPEDANGDAVPQTLYYHWCPHSSNQYEVTGFFSPEPTPDSGAWQNKLKQQGWDPECHFTMETYRMRDDWGRWYERELNRSMGSMPGSYPGAHIEEAS